MKTLLVSTLVLMSLLVIPDVFAQGNISIDQAISDEAQRKTIAFSGLAFLTGDMCSDTFFPPGKVSDFMGFQYMRDIASNGFGHNTMYAGNVSDNILGTIGQENVDALVDLANTQADQVHLYGYERFVLIDAFRRVFDHDMPTGATGLDMDAVAEFSADLYEIDALISYQRAQVLSAILDDLTPTELNAITQLHADLEALFQSYNQGDEIPVHLWPAPTQAADLSGLHNRENAILVSTYATQLYSWYLGSIYGDTYFCPERHGTYFGSFYMKDIPPLTASGPVSIDPNLTADMGQAFLDVLDATQSGLVTDLVDIQRNNLYDIVTVREQIATKLRELMTDPNLDIWDEVRAMVRQYGQLDGENVYNYATNFSAVNDSLYGDQASQLMALRTNYYELFPDYQADPTVYDCTTPWLYAQHLNEWPEITNTDFLFSRVQVVPAVAHVAGVNSYFTSVVHAFNASDETMTVEVTYTPRVDLGGSSLTAQFELGSGEMVSIDDPLATWFGFETTDAGVGSLLMKVVDGSSNDLLVTSVVLAQNDDGSEYGQLLPATAAANALEAGETAYLSTTVDGARMRVNLGAVAVEDGTRLSVRALDSAGLGTAEERVLELDAGAAAQLNDLASELELDTIEDHLVEVVVDSGAAIVYGSVLDGTQQTSGTSDPTTLQPVTTGATTVTLLELGSIQGYDEFSGSVSLSNLASGSALVEADLYLRDEPGVAAHASFTLPGMATIGFADLVGDLFGISSGVGTVVLTSSEPESLMATGREFSIFRDEAGVVVGTAGQLIPGMTADDLLKAGRTYHLLGLRPGNEEGALERSHVAAFNPGADEVEVTLDLYDGASGEYEGSTALVVAASELRQLNNIIESINPQHSGGSKRIEAVADGEVHLAAFHVNTSGDPVTIVPLTGASTTNDDGFVLKSSAFQDMGTLPVEYTCDGAGVSPPLEWAGAPADTEEYAILMTTLARDGLRWNWVLYDVPGNVTSLPEGGGGIGKPGLTSDGPLLEYYPPCAQGPGPKTYTFTVYALSAAPIFAVPEEQRSGEVVAAAISDITLASSQTNVTYTRPGA